MGNTSTSIIDVALEFGFADRKYDFPCIAWQVQINICTKCHKTIVRGSNSVYNNWGWGS